MNWIESRSPELKWVKLICTFFCQIHSILSSLSPTVRLRTWPTIHRGQRPSSDHHSTVPARQDSEYYSAPHLLWDSTDCPLAFSKLLQRVNRILGAFTQMKNSLCCPLLTFKHSHTHFTHNSHVHLNDVLFSAASYCCFFHLSQWDQCNYWQCHCLLMTAHTHAHTQCSRTSEIVFALKLKQRQSRVRTDISVWSELWIILWLLDGSRVPRQLMRKICPVIFHTAFAARCFVTVAVFVNFTV